MGHGNDRFSPNTIQVESIEKNTPQKRIYQTLHAHDDRQSIGGSMEITTRYKVISGASAEIEQKLNVLSQDGWRPVTMSCLGRPNALTVILENKIMEEARLSLPRPLEESALEEVQ